MRKTIILLFLLIIPLVFASKTETTKILNLNDTATVYGKTLTVLSTSSTGQLRVRVDGVEGIVKPRVNKTTNINEMYIEILNFTYVDEEYVETILELTVNYECGDKACNLSENSIICCTDCGCEENLKCINNVCQKEECVLNWDCDDNNPCTVDKCSTVPPRTCSNVIIDKCLKNDTCCPSICGPANDTDCAEPAQEEIVEEPVKEEEQPKAEEPKPTLEKTEKKAVITEKEKGILIMAGVALLVVIIGFLFFGKKS